MTLSQLMDSHKNIGKPLRKIDFDAMSPAPTQVGIKVSQSVSLLDFRQVSARLTPSAIAQWRWLMGCFS